MQVVNYKVFVGVSVALFISIFFDLFNELSIYLFVLTYHELIHYYVAKRFGYNFNKILFLPYGGMLYGRNNKIIDKHEIAIAISAPLFNVLISLIFIAFWWIFPNTYEYTVVFVASNISLGFFNLLPIFPLDGGRVLMAKLRNKVKLKILYLYFFLVTIIFVVLFLLLFVLSFFNKVNITYLFISFFLVISLFDLKSNKFFNFKLNEKTMKNNLVLPKKEFVVSYNEDLRCLIKYIKNDYYCEFAFLKDGKIIKRITENELINILKNN